MAKAVIIDFQKKRNEKIINANNHYSKISYSDRKATVRSILPFRVKFTNIGIAGYGPSSVPPIGIAIVGYNNYIL